MSDFKRILAVDYGDVRTGLALSDALGMMAGGIGTVKAKGMHELCDIVTDHAVKNKVGKIIIGDPVNMNGTRGPRSEKAHLFADFLREKTDIPVELYDERCSTMVAHTYLNATNTHGKKRKDVVDTLSAQIILQDYLDSLKNKGGIP
ncbi:MAG: Holliday junction resolvase RuvX [Clostridia bacterium]|nr:Holliday junction resolvase RuvX [Clostridia bacterium]